MARFHPSVRACPIFETQCIFVFLVYSSENFNMCGNFLRYKNRTLYVCVCMTLYVCIRQQKSATMQMVPVSLQNQPPASGMFMLTPGSPFYPANARGHQHCGCHHKQKCSCKKKHKKTKKKEKSDSESDSEEEYYYVRAPGQHRYSKSSYLRHYMLEPKQNRPMILVLLDP